MRNLRWSSPRTSLFLTFVLASGTAHLGAQTEIPRTGTHPGVQAAPFPYASAEKAGLSVEKLGEVTAAVEKWVRDELIVGAEVLLVKDGQVVLHEAIGWSDKAAGTPLQRNTLYRIRSMTKPFTGTSVLLLSEEGLLSLDDAVSTYLPSWRNELSGGITIRQLLSHSGGFVQGGFPGPFAEYPDLRTAVDAVGEAGPQNTPGERYECSDVGSATLGAIVAEVSGMPAEEFIQTRILEPLGFQDTYTTFTPEAWWAVRMNPTYVKATPQASWFQYWNPTRDQQFPFFRASGGLYTTVFDYARWLHLWMDRGASEAGPFLSPEVVVEALKPAATPEYGLHWEIFSPLPADGALPAFGHGGSDGTLAVAMPELNATALIFTQSRGNGILRQFVPLARAALQPASTSE